MAVVHYAALVALMLASGAVADSPSPEFTVIVDLRTSPDVASPAPSPVELPSPDSSPEHSPSPLHPSPLAARLSPVAPSPALPSPALPSPVLPSPALPSPELPSPELPSPELPSPSPVVPSPSPAVPSPSPLPDFAKLLVCPENPDFGFKPIDVNNPTVQEMAAETWEQLAEQNPASAGGCNATADYDITLIDACAQVVQDTTYILHYRVLLNNCAKEQDVRANILQQFPIAGGNATNKLQNSMTSWWRNLSPSPALAIPSPSPALPSPSPAAPSPSPAAPSPSPAVPSPSPLVPSPSPAVPSPSPLPVSPSPAVPSPSPAPPPCPAGLPACRWYLENAVCCDNAGIITPLPYAVLTLACNTRMEPPRASCLSVEGPDNTTVDDVRMTTNRLGLTYNMRFRVNWSDSVVNGTDGVLEPYSGLVVLDLQDERGSEPGECGMRLEAPCSWDGAVYTEISPVPGFAIAVVNSPTAYYSLLPNATQLPLLSGVAFTNLDEPSNCLMQTMGNLPDTWFTNTTEAYLYNDGIQAECDNSLGRTCTVVP